MRLAHERRAAFWAYGLTAALAALCSAGCAVSAPPDPAENPTQVRKQPFGKMPDGTEIDLYTLSSGRGLEANIMTYGATLTTVRFPDRTGKVDVITLHKDSLAEYLAGHPLFGSVVGRYANRIANAHFSIDGAEYKLEVNSGKHHIHGGKAGFQALVWKAEPVTTKDSAGVKLTLTSPDGQSGFPGKVEATVVYAVNANNELSLDYTATTDKPTHINLSNHAYWNLEGAESGEVMGHVLQLQAEKYVVPDAALIPTGELRKVEGTALDFTAPRAVGSRIKEMEKSRYDHCYVLNTKPGEPPALFAKVTAPTSGRVMEVLTTQPGVQFYTGNPNGLCLETQHYPDSPNQAAFPSTLLRPGQTFHEQTVYRFSVQK